MGQNQAAALHRPHRHVPRRHDHDPRHGNRPRACWAPAYWVDEGQLRASIAAGVLLPAQKARHIEHEPSLREAPRAQSGSSPID